MPAYCRHPIGAPERPRPQGACVWAPMRDRAADAIARRGRADGPAGRRGRAAGSAAPDRPDLR